MVKGLHAPREGSFREQVLDLNKNTLHYVALVFFFIFSYFSLPIYFGPIVPNRVSILTLGYK